jgi:hypothetical protein
VKQSDFKRPELLSVMRAADRLYRHRYGVVGVGVGTKFKKDAALPRTMAVQFYVVEKKHLPIRRDKRLPRYMFLRSKDGSIDRTRRITTDVIEVGIPRAACLSGERVHSLNDTGAISLLFHNKTDSNSNQYVLTCSHVVGDLRSSPPHPDRVEADCGGGHEPFATTIFSSTPSGGKISFDAALARVQQDVPSQPDCVLNTRPSMRVTGWLSRAQLRLPHRVRAVQR